MLQKEAKKQKLLSRQSFVSLARFFPFSGYEKISGLSSLTQSLVMETSLARGISREVHGSYQDEKWGQLLV